MRYVCDMSIKSQDPCQSEIVDIQVGAFSLCVPRTLAASSCHVSPKQPASLHVNRTNWIINPANSVPFIEAKHELCGTFYNPAP